MAKRIESAILQMARLEVALLAAEARLKIHNAEAEIRIAQMRVEIVRLG
jgi:hypothetical protein